MSELVGKAKKLKIDADKLIQRAKKLMVDSDDLEKRSLELSRFALKNIDESKKLLNESRPNTAPKLPNTN